MDRVHTQRIKVERSAYFTNGKAVLIFLVFSRLLPACTKVHLYSAFSGVCLSRTCVFLWHEWRMHLQENSRRLSYSMSNQIFCFQIRRCLGPQLSDVFKREFKSSVGIRGITLTLHLSQQDRWPLIKKHQA